MQKRGQLTIFIIIGILLLVVTAGVYFASSVMLKEKIAAEAEQVDVDTAPIKMFVEQCLSQAIDEGIFLVLSQGGYYDFVDANLFRFAEEGEKEILQIPYYFYGQKKNIPELKIIELETEKAGERFFTGCTENFDFFIRQGYQIEAGKPSLDITFNDKSTLGELTFPLTIIKGEKTVQLEKFFGQSMISVPDKYRLVSGYLDEQEKDPDYFLVGDLSALAYDYNFSFGFDQYYEDGQDVILSLGFEEYEEQPLIYSFALNYDWVLNKSQEKIEFEPILFLDKIPEWNITSPGAHQYHLSANGYGVNFSADTNDFLLDPKIGRITLETKNFPNDEYWYLITVTDIFNNSLSGPLYLNINVDNEKVPQLAQIEKQTAAAGKEFYYKVQAINPLPGPVLFTSKSYLFDINKKTGEISFTPSAGERGVHTVRVDVENEYGRMWERFELEIR